MTFFDGNIYGMICSYNANLDRVKYWLACNAHQGPDVWVELIPYRVTRFYIKRILGDLAEYRRIYGDKKVQARRSATE